MVSRYSSNAGPSNHGIRDDRATTLSPASEQIGKNLDSTPVNFTANSAKSRSIFRNADSLKSTRSILFTHTANWRIPSSHAITAWRRVCGSTPLVASIRIRARLAVDAPVAMLRVYCSWPGVSAMMNRRLGVEKWR